MTEGPEHSTSLRWAGQGIIAPEHRETKTQETDSPQQHEDTRKRGHAKMTASYAPRQASEHWRTTGRIFNIIIDTYVERMKGGKLDRCSVTVCRYDNEEAENRNWTPRHYSRHITAATRARLVRYAPMAMENRKGMRSANVFAVLPPVLPVSVSVPATQPA